MYTKLSSEAVCRRWGGGDSSRPRSYNYTGWDSPCFLLLLLLCYICVLWRLPKAPQFYLVIAPALLYVYFLLPQTPIIPYEVFIVYTEYTTTCSVGMKDKNGFSSIVITVFAFIVDDPKQLLRQSRKLVFFPSVSASRIYVSQPYSGIETGWTYSVHEYTSVFRRLTFHLFFLYYLLNDSRALYTVI